MKVSLKETGITTDLIGFSKGEYEKLELSHFEIQIILIALEELKINQKALGSTKNYIEDTIQVIKSEIMKTYEVKKNEERKL